MPDNVQATLTVLDNTQGHIDSIPGPVQIAVNALHLVDTTMTQSGVINTEYHQTLSTFTTIINGITRVCHPHNRWPNLTDEHT